MRIAIIGSGVSGLVTAHLLHRRHDVVLYESDERPGGHSDTHRVELPELTCDVEPGSSSTTSATTRSLPATRRTRDPHQAQRHELQCGRSAYRLGVAGDVLLHRLRPATKPGPARIPPDAGRRGPVQPAGPGTSGRPATRRCDPGGGARPSPVVVRVPGLVPRPLGLVDLVGRSLHLHSDPRRHLRPLLRAPRAAQRARPASMAHGRRRVEALRRCHRAPCATRAACGLGRPWARSAASPEESRS